MLPANFKHQERWFGRIIYGLIAVGIGAILLFLTIYLTQFHGNLEVDSARWGHFGDFFGGALGPILSFLGLLAVIATLRLQTIEFRASRQQNFDSTFFQMLQRFDDALKAIEVRPKYFYALSTTPPRETDFQGRSAFQMFYRSLKRKYDEYEIPDTPQSLQVASTLYAALYKEHEAELGQYLRLLFHVFKFVHTSDLSEHQKVHYANIARAQLSKYELLLLFYNGTTGEGAEGFAPLINRYGILKHVPTAELLHPSHRESSAYESTAIMSYDQRRMSVV